ncbi:MAG: DNA translocase FtsK, partial [Bacteroidia bacterium]|nr:DNA translocase FtsK [Bacteroidia bacterium]
MAQKRKTNSDSNNGKKNETTISRIKQFVLNEKFWYFIGFVLLVFAVYLTIAFISYLFTWKSDQSILDKIASEYFINTGISVENWSGKYGAILANKFIHDWFGLSSFSVIFLMVIIGFRLLKFRLLPLRKSVKFTIIISIWLSIALAFIFGDSWFILGGSHGYFACRWLNSLLGQIGTAFLLIITLFAFIIFSFDKAFVRIKNATVILFSKITEKNTKTDQPLDISQETGKKTDPETLSQNISSDTIENKSTTIEFDSINTSEIVEKSKETEPEFIIDDKRGNEPEDYNPEPVSVEQGDYDPTLELANYIFPSLDMLLDHRAASEKIGQEELEKVLAEDKKRIVETLNNYKIDIARIHATIGPTVTLYEIVPAPGVRISKIRNLEEDIALSLSALGIRIIAPMPGKGTIGIEVPNPKPEIVSMKSIIGSKSFHECNYDLPLGLGKTISNEIYTVDLTKMPHLLIAGATGQGKSVCINAILASLLYKKHPSQVKFVLIDPKKVELSVYSKIEKHFLAMLPDSEEPIVTDTKKVVNTMNSLCIEMEKRYNLLKDANVRNIKEYNDKFIKRVLNPEKDHRYLPYIIVIIDEFGDLIMTAGKEAEIPITRLAQLARAVGIHLIIATQRPTTNIITGSIKANFPVRIAFKVVSMIDSRTILDTPGANHLIGRGDMLILKGSEILRLQCAFIDTSEIETISEHIGNQQPFLTQSFLPEFVPDSEETALDVDLQKRDPLFTDAARLIVAHQQGSTSLIQRKFSI